ncbi:oxidoreductase [Edwardsiella ictaluri]|uniref:Phage P2 GpU n=2 Tax=Edwardsiella ictaluri TaxID=67780 RepID=C5BEQ3_EDWI9|nr:phage tail protein [Edwardsiella ictaluri]ACR70291.1 Phage P2 GpU [Edwardsiella ictaluri 93-146]AVZ82843.1 oxidoreductase [Edwardsiella ictaluri]EKS7762491.1 phage tail protein [Edwardsiella ictaluri]EKS7770441.1 phage tail protein [Edwardsiella ictaluri]EKS7773583.1 phage tail protein [Edwardsiella ictaluri]
MMMTLGLFVFSLKTLPYQDLQQSISWRHPTSSRVGQRPASQFIGVGDEAVTLNGVLLPELTGGRFTLFFLRKMADQGMGWPLIEGTGTMLGWFVIESVNITKSVFFRDGAARRIEFTLALKRIDPPKPGGKMGDIIAMVDGL